MMLSGDLLQCFAHNILSIYVHRKRVVETSSDTGESVQLMDEAGWKRIVKSGAAAHLAARPD
jgi:hypothetical protein